MIRRAKSCTVCARRTPDGSSRCELHKNGSGRPRPCLVCSRSTTSGNYCALHLPETDEAERNARNPYRREYKSAEYAQARRHRFKLARGRCEACNVELQPAEWECDHLIPLRLGGTNVVGNLRVLCKPCHRAKTREDRARK
jgi:5-methylcytosine-specific restriction protein A